MNPLFLFFLRDLCVLGGYLLPALLIFPAALSADDWLIDNRGFPARCEVNEAQSELVLSNGIVSRRFRLAPNLATTAIQVTATGENLIRAVRPEAIVSLNGQSRTVGGLLGQPNQAFLKPEWLESMTADPAGFRYVDHVVSEPEPRLSWKRIRYHAPAAAWPPEGKRIEFRFSQPELPGIKLSVFYELYDGVPCFCKWITIQNDTDQPVMLDRLTTEILAVVEKTNWVEAREGVSLPRPDRIHVETDFAFGGFNFLNANRHVVHWETDPEYSTQVNYLRQTPCLLRVAPTYGPAQKIAPGETFRSYHAFELIHDSDDQQRQDLALRKMYRVVAPWVTENPIMLHLKASQPEVVRQAIDQCAEVGFEMVILSFGSGFNVENRDPAYIQQWREIAEYARERGIEIGGYSLLSSRRIGGGNDIVSPEGTQPTHGNCPALTSEWGQNYFQTLYDFFDETGFTLLEHDGSYPGDVDVTPRPPFQQGELDSRWAQWQVISEFYGWCRERGIYLNVPDYYFLSGSNKCGMGYREVNWSLPRAQQVLHTRQNIFDGTRVKTPSMGWMFVPLTQYHGGGAAATVEPLSEHLDHYELMMASNFGAGVQACYRGPRIYDTDKTRERVRAWVSWFKQHRGILESDIIHGSSRRADGQDVDWILHADPLLEERGMLLVYNPLDRAVTREIPLDLYYTGIEDRAEFVPSWPADTSAEVRKITLDRRSRCRLEIEIPAGGVVAYLIRSVDGE